MIEQTLTGTTALVTGAGRGFGRAIAVALAGAGVRVVGVGRDRGALEEVRGLLGEAFVPEVADAADPVAAARLLDAHRPRTLVLNAGAVPLCRPLHQHTWESFGRAWETDVKQAFHWSREVLLGALEPGSTVISMSSGAALAGSPVSGGYAGAKATVRFVSAYAGEESELAKLGVRFVAVLPGLTPGTGVGGSGVAGYAARNGITVEQFVERLGPTPTPELVGDAVLRLATDPGHDRPAYRLTAAGLEAI